MDDIIHKLQKFETAVTEFRFNVKTLETEMKREHEQIVMNKYDYRKGRLLED